MVKEGSRAPDFTLLNQDQEAISLSDYLGKWVVLYFYPKDNTSGCTREACDFTEARSEFAGLDAVVIGISPDSTSSHRRFMDKHNLDLQLLSDPQKKVLKIYGAWGKKKNYGREYQGVIRSTFLISPKGLIEKIWKKVRVRIKRKGIEKKHADAVREALEELSK
jgi:peroxiredoxin Q/BCP